MKVQDIKIDNDDLLIKGGDFAVGDSDPTHIEHILISNRGYWFESPLLGVGIIDELNGSKSPQRLKQTISRQLVLDNYTVRTVEISPEGEIDINAERRI
jgi:hypothetical protein